MTPDQFITKWQDAALKGLFVAVALGTLTTPAQAEVFRCLVDGATVYQDRPCQDTTLYTWDVYSQQWRASPATLYRDDEPRAAIANRWVPAIQSRVRQFWVRPPGTDPGLTAIVSLRLNPGGDVVIGSVKIREGSGNAAFDRSVVDAVYNASPLPVPDGADFALFADFDLRLRP